jgi:hypothetical protein
MLEDSAGVLFDPDIVAAWRSIHLEASEPDALAHEAEELEGCSDIERAAREGHWLEMLADTVSGLTSVAEIGREATRTIEDHISPSTAFLWAVKGDKLVVQGDAWDVDEEASVPIGVGVEGWVAAEQSPLANVEMSEGPFSGSKVAAVPVVFDGRTVGVLCVYRGAS